jgi:DNA polymerase
MSAVFLVDGILYVWIPWGRAPELFRKIPIIDWTGPTVYPVRCIVGYLPTEVNEWIESGYTFVAHNAEAFDAQAWEILVGGKQPSWYDTIHCCRAASYPAGLDRAAKAIGVSGKDESGSQALKILYTARVVSGRYIYPVGTVEVWQQMLRYNIQDVLALEQVYNATKDYGEVDVLSANCRVNARGVPVNVNFAGRLRGLWHSHSDEVKREAELLSDGMLSDDSLQSPAKVKAWLRQLGFPLPADFSLNRAAIEAMIADPNSFFGDTDDERVAKAIAVLQARQSGIRATVGKVERLVDIVDDDGRIRDCLIAYGAHTGRFSSRDFQFHNLFRGVSKLDIESILRYDHSLDAVTGNSSPEMKQAAASMLLDFIKVEAKKAKCSIGDALATLMRPVIQAPGGKTFAIVDYSQVEGRGIAYLAGELGSLDIFADPSRDIYCETASKLYGHEVEHGDKVRRGVGKIIELACGYGMGENKFASSCKLMKVDLAAAGVSAKDCVGVYRDTHPNIVRYWKRLHNAATAVVSGDLPEVRIGKVWLRKIGTTFIIELPSGRCLYYRNACIRSEVPIWGGSPIPTIKYDSPHGYAKTLYGGLLAENITQAMCRDFLAISIVVLQPTCVLHVHDEVVCETHEDNTKSWLELMAVTMSQPPAWAPDFPLRVEGFTNKYYTKGAFPGGWQIDAMRGKVISLTQKT